MSEFADKVAIVTGAATGLGEAIAVKLYENGARIILADIDVVRAHEVAGRLDSSGKRVHT
ncbi:SDR family NAD(P)-dependent oxidoreductase [Nostoc sp.]|uniref:SDR family NAD(P)-dependent oxidoreductase n=1 Tax=Nostoc sp. TaxID=1180 RepID=UPI002FFBF119